MNKLEKTKRFEQSKAETRASAVIAAISGCAILWNVFNADCGAAAITGTAKVTAFLTWISEGNRFGNMANVERAYSKNPQLQRCSLWEGTLKMTSSDNND